MVVVIVVNEMRLSILGCLVYILAFNHNVNKGFLG